MDKARSNELTIEQQGKARPSGTALAQSTQLVSAATTISGKNKPKRGSGWWTVAKIIGLTIITLLLLVPSIVIGYIIISTGAFEPE